MIVSQVYYGEGTQTLTQTNTSTKTAILTPSATPTSTPTCTPTSSSLLQSVAAGTNFSKNGEPIKFMITLGGSARVQLNLYSLTGEQVFSETIQGNAGLNTILWLLRNNAQMPVASGIYVYAILVDNGDELITRTGKVLVLH